MKGAARYAAYLARKFNAQLTVVHVESYPLALPGFADHGASLGEWFVGRATASAIELRNQLAGLIGERARFVVLEGDPAARIVACAKDEKTDLIVMPARGQGALRRWFLGSVVESVLQQAGCAVCTGVHLANAPALDAIQVGTILCALDGTEKDLLVSRTAAAFAARLGAQLSAFHAVEAGEVADSVCRRARELHAGLIVIGRVRTKSVFGRLHANRYRIVRESPCPVLSV